MGYTAELNPILTDKLRYLLSMIGYENIKPRVS